MRNFTSALLLSTAIVSFALTAPAKADDRYLNALGWYATVHGGYAEMDNADVSPAGGGGSFEQSGEGGYNFGAGFGYNWNRAWRTELETTYRSNDLGSDASGGQGDATSWAFMLNNYATLNIPNTDTRPYIGLGVGAARVNLDSSFVPGPGVPVDDSDTTVAFQGMIGIEQPVSEASSIGLEYRYFTTSDLSFTDSTGAGLDYEYGVHSINLRLNMGF